MGTDTATAIERITPILHCDDALKAADWYARLGFETTVVYQPDPDDPRFVTLRADGLWLFLSEHAGDASPDTLVYIHVADVDAVARRLGVEARDMPWGMREIHLSDPAGNRVRVGAGIPGA
jgi:catechol 2,3-dioxygenase-like lactoylglutathione lyase family enzyme